MGKKVAFTNGKNEQGATGAGGMFSQGTGGWTSRGVHIPAGSNAGSTSNTNTRIGKLGKRMHGAGGTKGFPK